MQIGKYSSLCIRCKKYGQMCGLMGGGGEWGVREFMTSNDKYSKSQSMFCNNYPAGYNVALSAVSS